MGLGPIPAVKKVLEQAGMTIDDIDVLELNEAFAAQVVPCRDEWGIDPEKLNPNGGAIALGHPFGMTGARIMTTLLNNLDALDGTIGLETMCVAGGQGQAMIVERLTRAIAAIPGSRSASVPMAPRAWIARGGDAGPDRLVHLRDHRLELVDGLAHGAIARSRARRSRAPRRGAPSA